MDVAPADPGGTLGVVDNATEERLHVVATHLDARSDEDTERLVDLLERLRVSLGHRAVPAREPVPH